MGGQVPPQASRLSLSLSFGLALGPTLPAHLPHGWFHWVVTLQVTDLREICNCKKAFLYVNDAVTFSIHKVYIPINIIHIYYIYKNYFLYRPTWTNGPCCFLHFCADCHRLSSRKKLVSCFPFGATSVLSPSVSVSVSGSLSLIANVSLLGKNNRFRCHLRKGGQMDGGSTVYICTESFIKFSTLLKKVFLTRAVGQVVSLCADRPVVSCV